MAIRFIDGFDHYAFSDILRKWTFSSGTHTIGTSGARNGSSLTFSTAVTSSRIQKSLDNQATYIIGFGAKFPSFPSATSASVLSITNNGSSQVTITFEGSSSGKLIARRGTGAGTSLGTTSTALTTNTWTYIEVKIVISDTVGEVTIKFNGTTVLNLTGQDTLNTSTAFADTIIFNNSSQASHSVGVAWLIDDVYICDSSGSLNTDFLGDSKVETLYPTGAGNYSQWTASTGTNYQNVDETAPNDDTDYNYSSTLNQIDTYVFGDISNPALLHGIQICSLIRKDVEGHRSFKPVVRLDSVDHLLTEKGITDNYIYDVHVQETSPASSGRWSRTEINNAEFGIKLIS